MPVADTDPLGQQAGYGLETLLCFLFFNDTATTEIYTLSLHDALPIWSDAAIEEPGDIFVAHSGEDLPLHLEVAQDEISIHSALEDFDGGALLKLAVVALGEADPAHAAFTDVGDDLPMVQADPDERVAQDGMGDEIAGLFMGDQQGFDLAAEPGVARTGVLEISGALRRLEIQASVQERGDPGPRLGAHGLCLTQLAEQPRARDGPLPLDGARRDSDQADRKSTRLNSS